MGNDRRLKVLFLPGWYPSEENSVAGVFVHEHARAVSLYDDVVVLYVRRSDKRIRGLYSSREEAVDGIRIVHIRYRVLPIPKVSYFVWLYALLMSFLRLRRQGFRPDVIHAHIYYSGVMALVLGRIFHIPVVLSEHSSAFARGLLGNRQLQVARQVMKRVRIVMPVSKALQKCIEAHGIQGRFHIVPNTVSTELFYPAKSYKGTTPKRMLVVALLTDVKGITYLLEALTNLREIRQDFILDIVGDGDKRAEYEALSDELGLSDIVNFHGLKPKDEVADFMRRCDFLVQPSLFETFGVAVIEVLACGKPVVASNVGGLRETITPEVGILIPTEDSHALMKAIAKMLDSHQGYNPHSIAEYAEQRYSHRVIGKAFHEIYTEVVARR